ncbi:HRI1-like protein [Microdochium nivale]|nr:HRI1-like protein [Microdochium nivale]
MGSISIRRSVQWLPDDAAPSEPTSTIVLTSPGRRFVDIRILLPGAAAAAGKGDELASAHRHFGTITAGNLDWAFCGTSESSSPPPNTGSPPDGSKTTTHSKWHHLVSDRARDVTGVVDEGTCARTRAGTERAGDGADDEPGHGAGHGVRGGLGGRGAREDSGLAGFRCGRWRGGGGEEEGAGERRKCVVLEARDTDGEGGGICGMVVCLGRFCQGVVRRGERFGLERWSCREEDGAPPPGSRSSGGHEDADGGGGGGWKQRARLDTPGLWIPARQVIERAGSLNVGDVVVARHGSDGANEDGVTWTVVEAC